MIFYLLKSSELLLLYRARSSTCPILSDHSHSYVMLVLCHFQCIYYRSSFPPFWVRKKSSPPCRCFLLNRYIISTDCVIVIITVYCCSTVCIVKVKEEFCTLYLDQTSSQCNISTFDTTIFWCPCIAIDVSVQYNGGLLPDIILLTQCYFHGGSRLNALKRFCICSL